MKRYYLMAINSGDIEFYKTTKIDLMEVIGDTKLDTKIINLIYQNYPKLNGSYNLFKQVYVKNQRVEDVELQLEHFKYHPNGIHYEEIKTEFDMLMAGFERT